MTCISVCLDLKWVEFLAFSDNLHWEKDVHRSLMEAGFSKLIIESCTFLFSKNETVYIVNSFKHKEVERVVEVTLASVGDIWHFYIGDFHKFLYFVVPLADLTFAHHVVRIIHATCWFNFFPPRAAPSVQTFGSTVYRPEK